MASELPPQPSAAAAADEADFNLRVCSGPRCPRRTRLFRLIGDNHYGVARMHDDRVGDGPHLFCSRLCAIRWLREQADLEP